MPNLKKPSDLPANKALQLYFDGLSSPNNTPSNTLSNAPINEATNPLTKTPMIALGDAPIGSLANTSINARLPSSPPLMISAEALADDSVDEISSSLFSSQARQFQTQIKQVEHLFAKAHNIDDALTTPSVKSSPPHAHPAIKEKRVNADNTTNQGDRTELRSYKQSSSEHDAKARVLYKNSLPETFQVLLCEIHNVTIALPLAELGGIHQLSTLSALGKQPHWCEGILIKGDKKIVCINAATWLVPQRFVMCEQKQAYKFAIVLGNSSYAICCHSLSTTMDMHRDDIKWREHNNTQKWLSGLHKERMCALINADEMVNEVLNTSTHNHA